MFKKVNPRQNFPEMEKEIMNNWKENQTFERSVENREDEKTYSFFDGPPFATGLPHYGHVVASLIKDVVPRFQTMKGKKVNRRWGWDCHGLPVENLVEKEHGIKNKQDIEKWGVENFNDACHNSVLRYAEDWKKFIPRIGRWVDMENDYRTMDWKYTESIWWVFSELFKKGLVYEGHKAMHICPRCETTLSNFEVTQGYKDITDLSATVKFKLKKASVKVLRQKILNQVQDDSAVQDEEVFVLAWTTTPWTLPGNVALAVGFSIKYLVFSIKGKSGKFILAKDQAEEILKDEEFEILNEIDGKDLVGLEYYPLFGYMKKLLENKHQTRDLKKSESDESVNASNPDIKDMGAMMSFEDNAYKIYSDSDKDQFVTTDDGTGIVHIAPAFGEDDMKLGQKYNLPFVQHVSMDGRLSEDITYSSWDNEMTDEAIKNYEVFVEAIKDKKESERRGKWVGIEVKPKGKEGEKDPHMQTDIEIIKYLAHNNSLFSKKKYEHSYPHCWRCDTPLLNYATSSWFVKVTEIKEKMVENNKQVNWTPEYIKEGRFGKWLEDARDWAISRNRFWGAPLPIWRCTDCENIEVVNSIDDLREKTEEKITKFIFLRHGESESNVKKIKAGHLNKYHLTEKGIEQVENVSEKMKNEKIDILISSPIMRTKETAEIVKKHLNLEIKESDLIKEYDFGSWNGFSYSDLKEDDLCKKYQNLENNEDKYKFRFGGDGESRKDVEKRVREFIKENIEKYPGKTILVVSHSGINAMFNRVLSEVSIKDVFRLERALDNAERNIFYVDSKAKEFNLHKPNIDRLEIKCSKCQSKAKIVGDVFDCWFESGSMPYAQWHYPFENKAEFEKSFPADFIAEGLDQTRGWFYTLMVLSTALFDKAPFQNVIVNGMVLAEDGQKMSKRLKNYPEPNLVIEKYGADALRYYLLSSPIMKGESLRFSERGVDEVLKKFVLTLWNTYSFFVMNVEFNEDIREILEKNKDDKRKVQRDESQDSITSLQNDSLFIKSDNLLDRWIVSELHILTGEVNEQMESYDLVRASRPLRDFVDKLSNWYVRRSRKRFASDDIKDKKLAFQTLHYILVEYSKLLAPFMPFLSEEIYRNLTGKESVHLENFPIADSEMINEQVSTAMSFVRQAVTLGLAIRAKNSIKVRMPIAEFQIESKKMKVEGGELIELIKDELNVKIVKIVEKVEEQDSWVSEEDSGLKVAFDLNITDELRNEGLAREVIRHIQVMRKEAKFNRDDEVEIEYNFKDESAGVKKIFASQKDYIAKECLAKKLEFSSEIESERFDTVKEIKVGEYVIIVGIKRL
ncbi:class I tRNA ligase family protein [Candidatus Parcubacteria bacterium]|nr:class I tRNA ligase family protein [Candidatus Parcubacteria bacterium]